MHCLCRPSRLMTVRINLLDETDFLHEIKDDLPGQALLDVVFARLNLIETSYFGIRYIDEENQTHWLDPASRISRQLKPKPEAYDLYFGVKFYAADPCKLLEEITRYQLFLQVKQDVLQGRLPVAFELAAELGAFVVQSELGDYDQRRHSKGYVSEFRLLPNQTNELETRVSELHQQLKGMSPATAEMNYLDKVKWHEMYGVDLHPVLGEDSVEYFLGLTPSGIVVLRNKATVAHYYWPRVAKVYYKGRYFMLRISDKNNDLSTYGFETPRKSACKHLWRCCVEHHAFFRMVRTAPLQNSVSTPADLFQLGTRLKYSNRNEKNSSKDAFSTGRTPPTFTRVPSKRQPRRLSDDFLNGRNSRNGGDFNNSTLMGKDGGNFANNYSSPYRSTYSIPTSLGIRPYSQSYSNGNNVSNGNGSNIQTPDSPRSTRSAPWPRSHQQRSLFGNKPASPRSVRSASTTGGMHHHHHHHHSHHNNSSNHHHSHHNDNQRQHRSHHSHKQNRSTSGSSQRDPLHPQQQQQQQRYRSSSVESHSSNDSRSTRNRHKHRHRRTSDNESELSGRSGRSHHRKHRRSRHRRDSGSERDSSRGRSYSGHRTSSARSGGSTELIDSTSQWLEVQRRQAETSQGVSSVQQANVTKSSAIARSLHSNDSHSDTHSHHRSRRHRKNKSPSESKSRIWSTELAKHLQFGLVDTAGMTEDQLREIPYTVVETNSKRSTSNLKIHKSGSKSSVGGKSSGSGNTVIHGNNPAGAKNRVDRIRGLYYNGSNPNEGATNKNGSIRSASTISSRECDRNNGLVRMMSSMSMGDFISPTGSNLSPMDNSALRVSHEHTDSGLGADQDYAYSSERSSDSTRYGTNKSSGASSGSHRKPSFGNVTNVATNGSTYNSLMQQTVSNQQHQQQLNRQNSYFSQRSQQQQSHKPNIQQKISNQTNPNPNPNSSLAPIHNNSHNSSSSFLNSNNTPTNHNTNGKNLNGGGSTILLGNTSTTNSNNGGNGSGSVGGGGACINSANNRLLQYTKFENNQYKFSLNNVFAKNPSNNHSTTTNNRSFLETVSNYQQNPQTQMDSFVEWPNTPAAPYYYNGPSTSSAMHLVKKRDAKSDIGVPTRRFSGQSLTKTQLLSGQVPLASLYPMPSRGSCAGIRGNNMHPAKSDLFLSYIHSGPEYERPYIYNYKMPDMPEFVAPDSVMQHQQPQQQPQQQQKQQQMTSFNPNLNQNQTNSAYHISGSQTADPPILFGGAAPANDVLYYQFDNGSGKKPIVQQPTSGNHASIVGPLVFLQHGPKVAPSNATSSQQTSAIVGEMSTEL